MPESGELSASTLQGEWKEYFHFNSKHKTSSYILGAKVFIFIAVQIELWQGIQNLCIPLPALSLPKAFSHGNFKTRDNRL
jgi:hypothetical protein